MACWNARQQLATRSCVNSADKQQMHTSQFTDQRWRVLKPVFRPTRAWLYKTIELCPYTGWYAFQSLSPASRVHYYDAQV